MTFDATVRGVASTEMGKQLGVIPFRVFAPYTKKEPCFCCRLLETRRVAGRLSVGFCPLGGNGFLDVAHGQNSSHQELSVSVTEYLSPKRLFFSVLRKSPEPPYAA